MIEERRGPDHYLTVAERNRLDRPGPPPTEARRESPALFVSPPPTGTLLGDPSSTTLPDGPSSTTPLGSPPSTTPPVSPKASRHKRGPLRRGKRRRIASDVLAPEASNEGLLDDTGVDTVMDEDDFGFIPRGG